MQIKECFTKVKQVFLLYLWDSLVTLELISLKPLVGTPQTDPLAVKLLNNRLFTTKYLNINIGQWDFLCLVFENKPY